MEEITKLHQQESNISLLQPQTETIHVGMQLW